MTTGRFSTLGASLLLLAILLVPIAEGALRLRGAARRAAWEALKKIEWEVP